MADKIINKYSSRRHRKRPQHVADGKQHGGTTAEPHPWAWWVGVGTGLFRLLWSDILRSEEASGAWCFDVEKPEAGSGAKTARAARLEGSVPSESEQRSLLNASFVESGAECTSLFNMHKFLLCNETHLHSSHEQNP